MKRTSSAVVSRRQFIANAGAFGIGAVLLPNISVLAAEGERWPVSCRDMHLKVAQEADCWASMKALGAEGTEVAVDMNLACPNLFHPARKYSLADETTTAALGKDALASGRRITAFMMSNQLDKRLDEELKWTRAVVKAASQLGVEAIRIDVWPSTMAVEKFLPFAIDACKRLCEIAEGTKVRFGIENHGKVTNDPDFLDKLFEGVGSTRLGLTLDCANFYWFGHPLSDLYGIYERYAARVVHTHCKSIGYPEDKRNTRRPMGWEYDKYNCPIFQGDIDFKRLTGILRAAGYRGDLCLEDESLGRFPESERADIVRRELAMLKELR